MPAAQYTSIARKLTRMNMLVCTVALMLACAGFVAYDVASFRQAIWANLSSQARVAGVSTISALTFDDPATAKRALAAFSATPHIISAEIYTAGGRPFAEYRRDGKATTPATPPIQAGVEESHAFTTENVSLTRPVDFDGKIIGYVFIESDLLSLFARIKTYIEIVTVVLALSISLALSVSRLARRSIAVPIMHLARAAQAVSDEDNYAVRVTPEKTEGELALLINTFNKMLEQIESRDRNLKAAHDELERRVEARTAQLALANKELESFSYSVSHDLRAPLRTIDGFSLALEEDYGAKLDEEAKSYIHRVRAATQRMGVLIDDLLNLSRLSRLEMSHERVDLSAMARAAAADLTLTDEKRKVEWALQDGVQAYGDLRLLRVVIENLLGNAWKYTSRHASARIEFGARENGNGLVYYVKDDGAGFDPAYYEKLFGAFQRLHAITEFPGTGVGLATVQRIVRRHGGAVWAESAVEKGATFYFTAGKANGEHHEQPSNSTDRRQPGRRSADVAGVAKEQYQE